MKKPFAVYFLLILLLITVAIAYYSHTSYTNNVKNRYLSLATTLHSETKILIEQKQQSTLLVALSLARDSNVKSALLSKDYSSLDLTNISNYYALFSNFKHIWVHLITSDGISLFKSWTDRKGESILDIRKDVKRFLKSPIVTSVISVGKYDMTIKSMVPIYDKNRFLGLFEVITKVNSIARNLSRQKDTLPIVLTDKKYKKQLMFPYTNTFIDDYYVANIDVNPEILSYLSSKDIESLVKSDKEYHLIDDYFLTIYHLKDVHNNEMGYFFIFKDMDKISLKDLKTEHYIFVLSWFLIIAIILMILFYTVSKFYTDNLQNEIDAKTKELKDINEHLESRVEEELEKNRLNEMKLIQNEKLIQIGYMFKNIAHHWRQPLSFITTTLSALRFQVEAGKYSKDDIEKAINSSISTAKELSNNIDFFASSYAEDKDKSEYLLQDIMDESIKILEPQLVSNDIVVIKNYSEDSIRIDFSKNKLIDLFSTFLHNSYDALLNTKKEDKRIKVVILKDSQSVIISFEDNGEGIEDNIKDKLFQPYITTKHQAKGVGLSLYIARNIIVNELYGSIELENEAEYTKFIITIPINE